MNKVNKKITVTAMVLMILIVFMVAILAIVEGKSKNKDTYEITIVTKTTDPSNDFWSALIEGAELGAQEMGVELTVRGAEQETDIETQNRLIEQSINEKPDALLIAPCDYNESAPIVQKAVDKGLLVILVDSVVNYDIAQGIVSTDNYKAGRELGAYARELTTEKSVIGIVAHVQGTSTAAERENGIRAGLDNRADQIIDIVYCDSSYEKSYELTKDMLTRHPEITTLIGTNEYAAVGAAQALEEMGLDGKIKMVGFDNSVKETQYLEAGVFDGIVIQKPFNMGYLAVEQAVKAVKGYQIEYYLDSGCKLITREDMYEEENQRLLYQFSGDQ